jgi:flagellar protein FliO/FliZ
MMRLFILLYLLVSNTVFAVEKNAGPPELDVTSMLASLLLVIVCIFVFAYLKMPRAGGRLTLWPPSR